jgi:hypothetical protein
MAKIKRTKENTTIYKTFNTLYPRSLCCAWEKTECLSAVEYIPTWFMYSTLWNILLVSCFVISFPHSRLITGFVIRVTAACGISVRIMAFNATFNNILVISWRSVLFVEETGVPGENHDLRQVAGKLYHIMLYRVHSVHERICIFIGKHGRIQRWAHPARAPLKLEKIWFFGVKSGFFTLKKLHRAEGDAKIFGVFSVKNHDFTPKNLIFSNFRGGAPGTPPWIRTDRRCAKRGFVMESCAIWEHTELFETHFLYIYIMLKVQMTLLINSNMMMGRMKNNPDKNWHISTFVGSRVILFTHA